MSLDLECATELLLSVNTSQGILLTTCCCRVVNAIGGYYMVFLLEIAQ